MNGRSLRDQFLRTAELWLCQGSSLDIRYIALRSDQGWIVSGASVSIGPVPYKIDNTFEIRTSQLIAGCIQVLSCSRDVALRALSSALEGRIEIKNETLQLRELETLDWYAEAPNRETWFSPMQISVNTRSNDPPLHPHTIAGIEAELRLGLPPFDGLPDIGALLELRADVTGSRSPSIEVTLSPPVDLLLSECALADDRFSGVLIAHEQIDVSSIGLAIRAAPGSGLGARQQIASQVTWEEPTDGFRNGLVTLEVPNADSILTMLSFGGRTIRRNWFADPRRAPNGRYVSMIQSDPGLRMLRRAAFESPEARKLEQAVAALLHMLGFSSVLPAEQDSPDILVSTPGRSTLIVECTTRIADIHSKVGKLIERRAALSKALTAASLPANVVSVLVCRLPNDEIPTNSQEMADRGVLLFSREDIEAGLRRARFIQDPDALLREWLGANSAGGINE